MRSILNWGGAALIAGLLLPALAWADVESSGEKTGNKGLDGQLLTVLRDVTNEGVELYNSGDHAGCYHTFRALLMSVKPLLASRSDLQKKIDEGLAEAERMPNMGRRAYALRFVLDDTRSVLLGKSETKPGTAKTETKPSTTDTKPLTTDTRPSTTDTKPTLPRPETKPPTTDTKPMLPKPTTDTKPPSTDTKPMPPRTETKPPTTDTKPSSTDTKPAADSLWARLGGKAGVTKVIDEFVEAAATDPKVNFDRDGKYKLDEATVTKLKKSLVEMVSEASGGDLKYTGKSMKDVHKGMGITDAEFDASKTLLKKAMENNGVKAPDVQAVLGAVEKTRADIVEKK